MEQGDLIYDNVGGNVYDKYSAGNPVARYLMDRFLAGVAENLRQIGAKSVFEVGCGEGLLARYVYNLGIDVRGIDLEPAVVEEANSRFADDGESLRFEAKSVYDLTKSENKADAVLCCEVLEHLPDPRLALERIREQESQFFVFSVPNEPVWRILNLCRLAYVRDFGNTPGHINHWSSSGFVEMVGELFEIVSVKRPLPWTIVLARKSDQSK